MSEDPDEVFKVWPTNVDRDDFRRVMNAGSPDEVRAAYGVKRSAQWTGQSIADAYIYFHREIDRWLDRTKDGFEARLDALFRTLREEVRMVVIDLGAGDDAQLIFETLNARGTPLLPADLVKNFLFHRADLEKAKPEPLYREFWQEFDVRHKYWRELLGRGHARRARIDLFLQYYLTLRSGDEVPVGHLYGAFRKHVADVGGTARDHLASFHRYAGIHQSFDRLPPGTRDAMFFERLGAMDVTSAYPFLLELYARHGGDDIERHGVLDDLESFLVRRMIVGLNTRGYARLFVELVGALNAAGDEPRDHIRTFLLAKDVETHRWPNDEEFRSAWVTTPMYQALVRRRVNMVLRALELGLRTGLTESLSFGEALTIEHLMPQKWRKHWPLADGGGEDAAALRDRELHTIGNLTLLTNKLTPTVSNGRWTEKRTGILAHSALSLNRPLQYAGEWNEEAIRARAGELFKVARKVWARPPS